MSYFVTTINNNNCSINIESFLRYYGVAQEKINYLIANKCCYTDGKSLDQGTLLKAGETLCIETTAFEINNFLPEKQELKILYEDEYLLIVDKPSRCIIYPDSLEKTGTMANYILAYYDKIGLEAKVRHVHRLDFDTTGCLVYAKDLITHAYLTAALEKGTFFRKYIALVEGKFTSKADYIDLAIGKDRHVNGKMIISKNGKYARTHYEVLKEKKNFSLVSLELETGRTHQIRVHLSAIGHPLVGDTLYGALIKGNRVFLHSSEVDFIHPFTEKKLQITSSIPKDMNNYWNNIK